MSINRKLEVKDYDVPQEMREIAHRRGMDIYRKWAWNPHSEIETLIVSLYMQGINDAIAAFPTP